MVRALGVGPEAQPGGVADGAAAGGPRFWHGNSSSREKAAQQARLTVEQRLRDAHTAVESLHTPPRRGYITNTGPDGFQIWEQTPFGALWRREWRCFPVHAGWNRVSSAHESLRDLPPLGIS
jgi:hypothetical protein